MEDDGSYNEIKLDNSPRGCASTTTGIEWMKMGKFLQWHWHKS